jgi:hypothetical protein
MSPTRIVKATMYSFLLGAILSFGSSPQAMSFVWANIQGYFCPTDNNIGCHYLRKLHLFSSESTASMQI